MKKIGIWLTVIIIAVLGSALLLASHNNRPAKVVHNQATYVALGDSVAAGQGLKDYSDASACERTQQAYPNAVAAAGDYKLVSLACSGATIPVGVTGSQTVNKLALEPQLQQLFMIAKPALISLTIGANDADWSGSIQKCYLGDCGTPADTAAVNDKLQSMAANLKAVLTQIRQHYPAAATKIVVTSYYQVFPMTASADCSDLSGITAGELTWGRQQQADLNQTVQTTVATVAGVSFVPVSFSGHELCTNDPWVQGLTGGAPYHPTEAGQAEFAKQIRQTLKVKAD